MPNPVVHFEIIGTDPTTLRAYYRELFGWDSDTQSPVAFDVSDAGQYGFIEPIKVPGGTVGVAGGIGGGERFTPHAIFYVGVDDVEITLERAVALGGTHVMGPVARADGAAVVGHFTDPEGNLVGVTGPK